MQVEHDVPCLVCSSLHRIVLSTRNEEGLPFRKIIAKALAGAVAAGVIIPKAATAVGFTSNGVAKGSWAAWYQSSVGNISKGSLFSLAQSAAAKGGFPAFGGLGIGSAMLTGFTMAAFGIYSHYQNKKREEEKEQEERLRNECHVCGECWLNYKQVIIEYLMSERMEQETTDADDVNTDDVYLDIICCHLPPPFFPDPSIHELDGRPLCLKCRVLLQRIIYQNISKLDSHNMVGAHDGKSSDTQDIGESKENDLAHFATPIRVTENGPNDSDVAVVTSLHAVGTAATAVASGMTYLKGKWL